MRERGRGGHQQAQDFQSARVGQQLDLFKVLYGIDFLHGQLRKNLLIVYV